MTDERQLPDDGSPPGHLEKMLGRKPAEDQNESPAGEQEVLGSNSEAATRPDHVPEKFWDAEKGEVNTEALLKAQADAEKALRQQQNEGTEDPNEGTEDPEVTPNQQGVVDAASAEWEQKGELSEDTFKALEGVGLSRDMVNSYIAGQQAIVNTLRNAAYEPFKGKEGYDSAAQWAAENLSEAEIRAIDVQLTSTDPEVVAQGAKALQARYESEADIEPSAIRGNANVSTNGDVYRSRAEMMRDMSSARYRTDEGFRQEVAQKLRRSRLGQA